MKFDLEEFKKEFELGEMTALRYLEKTKIQELKDTNKYNNDYYTRNDYLINLFYAVLYLDECNIIYETSMVKNSFNWDYYATVRDLLFKELGIELEED